MSDLPEFCVDTPAPDGGAPLRACLLAWEVAGVRAARRGMNCDACRALPPGEATPLMRLRLVQLLDAQLRGDDVPRLPLLTLARHLAEWACREAAEDALEAGVKAGAIGEEDALAIVKDLANG